MKKDGTEIIRPGRKIGVPFVAVVFFLMLLYLLLRAADLLRGHTISAYNVGNATTDILDRTFTGVILRDEEVIRADASGEVQYFTSSGSRVSKDSLISVVDTTGTLGQRLTGITELTGSFTVPDLARVRAAIDEAQDVYDPMDFSTAAERKAELRGVIFTLVMEHGGENKLEELGISGLIHTKAAGSGFVLMSEDGYESKTPETLTAADFSEEAVSTEKRSGDTVTAGGFLFKLVSDNRFTLVFPLTDTEKASLTDRKNLTVTMPGGSEITGAFSMTTLADGTAAGVISFQKYGLNYLDERQITFRIRDSEVTGYKIPATSLTKKSFFVVPEKFISENGSDNTSGVLAETAEGVQFIPCTVYRNREKDADGLLIGEDVAYIFSEELTAGQQILLETMGEDGHIETERESLGVMASLEGVYLVNLGYCVFKPVVRLRNSLESSYIMVSSEISYSLRPYDRIVLDASEVRENEIIYE